MYARPILGALAERGEGTCDAASAQSSFLPTTGPPAARRARAGLAPSAARRLEGSRQLVEGGDDTTDGYKWSEPTKCECGLSWNVHDASAFFNQKSTAQDITTLYATIQFPDKPSEPCDEPWDAVVQGRCKRFRIFKNKTTGKFWLFCTKRVQWHCEIVEL